MAFTRYGPRKGTRRPRRYAGRKARPSGKKNSFAARVKKVIHSQVETKNQTLESPLVSFNSAATSSSDCLQILPNVAQGGDNSQRIGDEIMAQSLNIRGHIILNNGIGAFQSRTAIRMMIVKPKRFNNFADSQANYASWINGVLTNGTGEQGLDGTIKSLYLPANRHTVTVMHDKVIYITQPYIPTQPAAGVAIDYTRTVKFFNINLKCKNKKLVFDNLAPANSPNNFGPVLLFSYVHLDGTSPDTVTTNVAMTFLSNLTYEDA